MIYVTGDAHRNLNKFYAYKNLTNEDILIVAGDFGFIWDGSINEQYLLNRLNKLDYKIYFVDGNHECFELLYGYPIVDLHDGKAHKINDNVYHLMRGEVYIIDGQKIFTMGGAISQDKNWRTPGITWWPEEVPSRKEALKGLDNLEKHNWKVDYVITHDLPASVMTSYKADLPRYILETYKNSLDFKIWYAGHYHVDELLQDKFQILYYGIVPLGETLC